MVSFTSEAEKDNVEFKTAANGQLPASSWETISAFSNMEGGTIYFGVRPDGRYEGLSATQLDQLQRSIQSDCANSYNQVIYPQITVVGNAVAAYIPPAPAALKPIYSAKRGPIAGGRVRIGSANVHLDAEWLKRFAVAARGGAELVEHQEKWQEVLDEGRIQAYIAAIREKRGATLYSDLSTEEILRKLRALSAEKRVTVFGLLAFGRDEVPQEVIGPTTNVAVTQYAGTTKVNPTDATETSLDDREFSGDIVDQFQEAFRFLQAKVPQRSRIDETGRRITYPAIPPVAIREALANALTHRDYSINSSRVQADVYADRIEIISPGRSLVPIHELEDAHSETRNPVLMNYLKDLGVTEQRARGIRTIKTSLRKAGLLEPVFEHRGNSFAAVLYSSSVIADDDEAWLRKFQAFELNDRQRNALVHARHADTGINNTGYRSVNHMNSVGDDIRAKKELQRLVVMGLLRPVGDKRYRRYVLGKIAQ